MPHISIKPEVIFELFNLQITNSLITSLIVSLLLLLIGSYYYSQNKKKRSQRSLGYYTLNSLLRQIYQLFYSVIGDKITIMFPLLATFFLFILFQNWFGLLPGVGSVLITEPEKHEVVKQVAPADDHAKEVVAEEKHEKHFIPLLRGGTADLNTTLALGIIAVIAIQYFGIKYLGLGGYLGKFFNFKDPIMFFIGILEIVSEISRAFSFSFRLFGNIIAGEILLVIIATLVPVALSFPFLIMEIFVGLIQAVVFATLAAIFINMATAKSH
jgi:F-type H+-transporting ATPase subunit a